jgi:hypothetical protein
MISRHHSDGHNNVKAIRMSQTNPPTPTPIALEVPYVNGPAPGYATLYIEVQNSDGTAPALENDPSTEFQNAVVIGGVTPNAGANTDFPTATYPYVGTLTAQAAGSALIDLVADGVVCQQFEVTVTQAPPETATVPATGIVVTPPG